MNTVNVVIIDAPETALKGASLGKAAARSVFLGTYAKGDAGLEAIPGAVKAEAATLPQVLGEKNRLVTVHLRSAEFDAGMEAVAAARTRHTLVVVMGNDGLLFSGAGVTRSAETLSRSVCAADVAPTICYMSGLPLPPDPKGAVVYQVMKDPNAPFTACNALKATLEAMEHAMERETREPWDKHDCA